MPRRERRRWQAAGRSMPLLPELRDRRLLIIDDEPEDRRRLASLAQSRGCVVREAADLQERNAIRRNGRRSCSSWTS